ncbi:MAG: dienelactone hydrolase family protein [Acidiferrobacteraceae bacterium]
MHTDSGTLDIGTGAPAFWAAPAGSGRLPVVIVFMEVLGLDASVEDLCHELASAGVLALAPDFYHGERFTRDQLEQALGRLRTLRDDSVMADVAKAIAALERHARADADRIGVFGVCMGGRLAFLASAVHGTRLRSSVCCYGGGIAPLEDRFGRPPLLDRVEFLQAPMLLVYGAEDASIRPDEHARIAEALSMARRRYVLSVYPEVGHAFLNAHRPGYRADVAASAWKEIKAFLAGSLQA